VIHGRPYYPQTQGLVEVANRTFKARLCAIQASLGVYSWVACLPDIALVINTSKSSALPSHVTPYEVHFGRKPHWIGAPPLLEDSDDEDSIDGDDDDEYPPTDINDFELMEIEAQIVKNNLKVHEKMAKKGALETSFQKGDLVTLKVPPKLRLVGEMPRIPVRIIKVIRGR
jgi:hypothetical protein